MAYAFNDDRSKVTVDSKADVDAAIAATNTRLDNMILNPMTDATATAAVQDMALKSDGTTASSPGDYLRSVDAEVIDIRTGYDNTVYQSAGNAVRSQINDIHDDINNVNDILEDTGIEYSYNLYDYKTAEDGYLVNSSGSIVENENYCLSERIYIPDSWIFTIRSVNTFAVYKEDGTFIERVNAYNSFDSNEYGVFDWTNSTLRTVHGAKYVRLNVEKIKKTSAIFSEGSEKKPYVFGNKIVFNNLLDGARGYLDKRDIINFGNIPTGYYYGKHIDTTGLDQDSSWTEAIEPWNLLAAGDAKYWCTVEDLGTTWSNAHMYKYKFIPPRTQNASDKVFPKILIVSGLHGHEKSGSYGLFYLITDMLYHATESPELNYLRNHVQLEIIPCVNAYGWQNNVRYNFNGVNLNRNYPAFNWSDFDNDPTYTTPNAYNYRGSAPFSEIESRLIRNWILANPDALAVIDIHTNGLDTQYYWDISDVLTPYFYHDQYDAQMKEVGDTFVSGLRSHLDTIYGVNGTLDYVYGSSYAEDERPELINWVADEGKILSVLLECTPGSSNGFLGNQLSQYSPDVIKLNAEMIGNLILQIIAKFA